MVLVVAVRIRLLSLFGPDMRIVADPVSETSFFRKSTSYRYVMSTQFESYHPTATSAGMPEFQFR